MLHDLSSCITDTRDACCSFAKVGVHPLNSSGCARADDVPPRSMPELPGCDHLRSDGSRRHAAEHYNHSRFCWCTHCCSRAYKLIDCTTAAGLHAQYRSAISFGFKVHASPICFLQRPVTVPLMAGMRSNSSFLNLDDPTFAGASATGNTPTQVRHTWHVMSKLL